MAPLDAQSLDLVLTTTRIDLQHGKERKDTQESGGSDRGDAGIGWRNSRLISHGNRLQAKFHQGPKETRRRKRCHHLPRVPDPRIPPARGGHRSKKRRHDAHTTGTRISLAVRTMSRCFSAGEGERRRGASRAQISDARHRKAESEGRKVAAAGADAVLESESGSGVAWP